MMLKYFPPSNIKYFPINHPSPPKGSLGKPPVHRWVGIKAYLMIIGLIWINNNAGLIGISWTGLRGFNLNSNTQLYFLDSMSWHHQHVRLACEERQNGLTSEQMLTHLTLVEEKRRHFTQQAPHEAYGAWERAGSRTSVFRVWSR